VDETNVHQPEGDGTERFQRPEPSAVGARYRAETRRMETTQTTSRRLACRVDELENGTSKRLEGEPPIAVYRNDDGEFFATADTCTHEEWSLGADSDLEGNEVVCPLHLARFDIRSGKALCFPATVALDTYDVEVLGDDIWVVV